MVKVAVAKLMAQPAQAQPPASATPRPKLAMVEPDPFAGTSRQAQAYIPNYYRDLGSDSDTGGGGVAGYKRYREMTTASRPVNGFTPKPNTFATVQVLRADGTPVKVFNRLGREVAEDDPTDRYMPEASAASTEPNAYVWSDWLLLSVQEARAEKTQIVETFGDTYLYAFGQRPRVLSFAGLLYNTADFNWRAIFWENWDRFFRATRLVEMGARMYIHYDDILVEGYPLDASAQQSANEPNAVNFSFTFFVTNYTNLLAQRGFDVPRSLPTSVVSGGFSTAFDSAQVRDSRWSLLEQLGAVGAARSAKAVFDQLSGSVDPALAAFIGSTVADSLAGAQMPVSPAQLVRSGVVEAEQRLNLKPGEINAWFGYLSDVVFGRASTALLIPGTAVDFLAATPDAQLPALVNAIIEGMGYTGGIGNGKTGTIVVTGLS